MLLVILKEQELLKLFLKNNSKNKTKNKKEFRVEKLLKGKDDKSCVKWNAYDNSFNNWTDKKT